MQTNETEAMAGCSANGRFEVLKQRLLHERLNRTPESETHALIMRQADLASFLAWLSRYPVLTFPCLFEERADAAVDLARREARRYWDSLFGMDGGCRPKPTGQPEVVVSAANVTQTSQNRHGFAAARR